MALTSDSFFSAVIQTAPGFAWDDPSKVLSDATGSTSSSADTQTLELSTPNLDPPGVPGGSVITDIQITVMWFRGAAETINGELTITGGATKTFPISEPPTSGEVYPGDLAYWDITAQEAADFASGAGGSILALRMVQDSGGEGVACGWVSCQFTYEDAPPSTSVVPNPVLF